MNQSDRSGTVQVHAVDDSGQYFGPVSLPVEAKATVHFTARDLEEGNAEIGISGGLGHGEGNWRLGFDTELEIEALAYSRDSALVGLHNVVAEIWPLQWYVPTFNPGSNHSRRSFLRLINPHDTAVEVVINGLDDAGNPPPVGNVRLTLRAGAACTITAQELESGEVAGPCDGGFSGRFGDGMGKWQLLISADRPIQIMNLLKGPDGAVTNLSTPPTRGFGPPQLTPSGSVCVRCPYPRLDILFDSGAG